MGLPIIDISFKQLAKSAVIRSQRGIVALILKDTTKTSLTVFDEGDIPSDLTGDNQGLIKDVLKGSPNKIELFVLKRGILNSSFILDHISIFSMPTESTYEKILQ